MLTFVTMFSEKLKGGGADRYVYYKLVIYMKGLVMGIGNLNGGNNFLKLTQGTNIGNQQVVSNSGAKSILQTDSASSIFNKVLDDNTNNVTQNEINFSGQENSATKSTSQEVNTMMQDVMENITKIVEDAVTSALEDLLGNESNVSDNSKTDNSTKTDTVNNSTKTGSTKTAKPDPNEFYEKLQNAGNVKSNNPLAKRDAVLDVCFSLDVGAALGVESDDDIKDKSGEDLYNMLKEFENEYCQHDVMSTVYDAGIVKLLSGANEKQMKDFVKALQAAEGTKGLERLGNRLMYVSSCTNNISVSREELSNFHKKTILWDVFPNVGTLSGYKNGLSWW